MQQSRVVGQRPVSEGHLWTLATNHSEFLYFMSFTTKGTIFIATWNFRSQWQVNFGFFTTWYLIFHQSSYHENLWIISRESHLSPCLDATLILNPWLFAVQVSRTRSSALIADIQRSTKQEKNPMFCVDGIRIQWGSEENLTKHLVKKTVADGKWACFTKLQFRILFCK